MVLTKEPARYSLLIADDDADSRETLRDIVEPEGFHTYLAGSGEEALEIVQDRPIHLLLCDMHMPRMTGLETFQIVRQINQGLPCILVSGDVDDTLVQQALRIKVYSVIAKPVSKNQLLYTVMRALIRFHEAPGGHV